MDYKCEIFSSSRLWFTIDLSIDSLYEDRFFFFSAFCRSVDAAADGRACRDVKYYFSPALRRWWSRYHTNCKLKTEPNNFEPAAKRRAGGGDRPPFPSHLYVSYFSLFWTALESTKSERRIVFTQPAVTADSQTAEGKSSGHCVPLGHIWNSRAVVVKREQTVAPTCSIKDDWNESLLPTAGVFYSKLGFMSHADVANRRYSLRRAKEKCVCMRLTFPPNKFKPVYRIRAGKMEWIAKLIKSYYTGEGNTQRLSAAESTIERKWHRRAGSGTFRDWSSMRNWSGLIAHADQSVSASDAWCISGR